MHTLRIAQSSVGQNRFRVEATFAREGIPLQAVTSEFDFDLSPQNREGLRWYLEDYLQHIAPPAPQIAARVEKHIEEIGVRLFRAVFESSETATRLWARLQDGLADTRVEVVADVQQATAIPWELLRDPLTGSHLALEARAFVRTQTDAARSPHTRTVPSGDTVAGEPVRILLVICRPGGRDDVPFRSVAGRLIKGLSQNARKAFRLDVLRPPTFAQLSKTLQAAKAAGRPYHIVHFDGHGAYLDKKEPSAIGALVSGLGSMMLAATRQGSHGYLLFENADLPEDVELVDGPSMGNLLWQTDVPVLVLNACRSAHAEPPAAPDAVAASGTTSPATSPAHTEVTQVRAFGSLAQEVVDAGITGVVAMRYNVYVVTAAQFVADLYEALAQGHALGDAVALGRKQLAVQPQREIGYLPRPLQDWMVPIVYETMPVVLFPRPAHRTELGITLSADAPAPSFGAMAPQLERRPSVGFFGRDETLLALDRAFDRQAIVLLHAYAGSGKSSTAAEFVRWYRLTGGIEGTVLFTTFQQYQSLTQVLNATIGETFAEALEARGIHWWSLPDDRRPEVALWVMTLAPVLWVWDNVEPIAGFPAGMPSLWSEAEQRALADFLAAAAQTRAKFLLTSRRDERAWLGDVPVRVQVPPMPMQERVQLARALAERQGRRLSDVEDWMPLLLFTGGNPLTVTVLVGQALREGLKTRAQVEGFVTQLRSGGAGFADEITEGRDRSLGASLSYGFEHAFSETERKQLALLHFFQGIVDVDALRVMGRSNTDWCVAVVRDLTREAGIALLDRAAEIGLLTSLGSGYYAIHPATPWFLSKLFTSYHGQQTDAIAHAYVIAMSALAEVYRRHFDAGQSKAVSFLDVEEQNLLHALSLARSHRWYELIVDVLRGLDGLYKYKGRPKEWQRLIGEILPTFVDAQTSRSLPGLEEWWSTLLTWKGRIARENGDFVQARATADLLVDDFRRQVAPILSKPKEEWTGEDQQIVRRLAVTLHNLGMLLWKSRDPASVTMLDEAFTLSLAVNEREDAANSAFHLGHVYMDVPEVLDLTKAEQWYRTSIELGDKSRPLKVAMRLHELGQVQYVRFTERRKSGDATLEELSALVNQAAKFAYEGLQTLPDDATEQQMHLFHLLGNIYDDVGDSESALKNYHEAIRRAEARDAFEEAARYCREIARSLLKVNRLPDALEYAQESVRRLTVRGEATSGALQAAQQLVASIQARIEVV